MVTSANKGIGRETVRKQPSQGVTVVLIARNEKRGMEAMLKLNESSMSNVVFHQLDVLDPVSINSLANFIQEKFGRLDILVRMKLLHPFSFFQMLHQVRKGGGFELGMLIQVSMLC